MAFFPGDIEVQLAPFMGIIAVAPPPELVRVSTKPPGPYGGNMDCKHLTAGSTLYLPVFNAGALAPGDAPDVVPEDIPDVEGTDEPVAAEEDETFLEEEEEAGDVSGIIGGVGGDEEEV